MKRLAFEIFRIASSFLPKRVIGKVPALRSTYKALYRKLRPTGLVLLEVEGSKMYLDPLDVSVSMDIILTGHYAKTETRLLKRLVKKGMTVADIGANIGYHTLLLSRLVGPEGKVYAFEAEPYNCSLLRKSIQANGYKNIELIEKALTDISHEKIEFFYNKKNFGSGSMSLRNVRGETDTMIRETAALDDFLADIGVNLIKMDVQGGEGRVLRGGKKTLASSENIVIVTEFWPYGLENVGTSPEKLLRDLIASGFEVRDIDGLERVISNDDIVKLIDACKSIKNGWGSANLLLEKKTQI